MVNYGGLKCIVQSLSIPEKTGDVESWRISQLSGPMTTGTSTVFDPKNYAGEILDATYRLLIHNKIYISQTEFSYDLITEEIEETITLWNADQIVHTLLSVNITGGTAGISFDIGSLPRLFTAETAYDIPLTIYGNGPAIQNNTINLIFDNITISITIYGVRIKAFPFDANYDSLEISYQIKSVLFENEHFQEQRRPLQNKILREQSVNFLFSKENEKRFVGQTRALINKVMGIPIYSEPMHQIAADIYNLSNISVEMGLNDFFNLADIYNYVVIMNIEKNIAELKELISYSNSAIVLKYPVLGHFLKDTTIIYPAMVGIISEKPTIEAVTNQVVSAQIKFREVSI